MKRYTKDEFLKLLAAYATLRYGTGDKAALLDDQWMVEAIRERIWTPPFAPAKR